MVGEGGRGGEVGDELERPLARHVDLDLGADRTHGGAILSPRARRPGPITSRPRKRYDHHRTGRSPSSPVPEGRPRACSTGCDARCRERSSASAAALSCPFRRTTRFPIVRAVEAPPSAATRSSSRCRSTAARRSSSPLRPARTPPGGWRRRARSLPGGGRYLVFRSEDAIQVFEIEEGWTRIGRSVAADIRLDHPSVSRRHALIVSEPDSDAAGARRPQPQRRLRQRRGGRVGQAQGRRRTARSAASSCSPSKPEIGANSGFPPAVVVPCAG